VFQRKRGNQLTASRWRAALTVPAALAVGAMSLLGASAAHAEPIEPVPAPVVLSPADGELVDSRTVLFEGAGANGATIELYDAWGEPLPGTETVVADDVWQTEVTFPGNAPVDQTVFVFQFIDDVVDGTDEVSFELPAPYPGVVVLSPAEGELMDSRSVLFEGAGANGATIGLYGIDGNPVPGTEEVTVVDNVWQIQAEFPVDASADQTVFAIQSFDGVVDDTDEVSFQIPGIAGLVITSPESGEFVDSRTVLFEGLGAAGATVNLLPGGETVVGDDNRWQLEVTFPVDAPADQTVFATQWLDDTLIGEDEVSFQILGIPGILITAPADGERVDTRTVTFSGVGAIDALVSLTDHAGNPIPGAETVVGPDNRWQIEVEFAADAPVEQSVMAIQQLEGRDDTSDEVAFLLPEPASGSTPGTSNPGGSSTPAADRLAETGVESVNGAMAAGALFIALGGALFLMTRLRTRQES
jgi:hypothetical protein